MSDSDRAAQEVLKRIMSTPDPNIWPLGSWLKHKETPDDEAALASLDPWLGYPAGGQMGLLLPGWDQRSVWGFDPQDDAYFAQLWRNGSRGEHPDIWICGRGSVEGREFIITTARLLAQEIAAAAGLGLPTVCTAMIGPQHRAPTGVPQADKPEEPPVSLMDELRKQGWF
jgi:hypothetical protein